MIHRRIHLTVMVFSILSGMFGGMSFVIAAPSAAECLQQATFDKCATSKTFLNDCPEACTGKCINLTEDEVKETPMLCRSCQVISDAVSNSTYMQNINGAIHDKCQALFDEARETQNELCSGGTGPKGCCLSVIKPAEGDDGPITQETCLIPNPNDPDPNHAKSVKYNYADCWCEHDDSQVRVDKEQSLKACTFACHQQNPTMEPSRQKGIGAITQLEAADAASQSEIQATNALCFTLEECSDPAYGGSPDAWVASSECKGGKGKCRAPEPVLTLSSPILKQVQVRGFRQYIDLVFRFLLSITVLAAAIMFIWGGFKYVFGSAAGSVSSAKETMTNAVIGLILMFGAVTMLNVLNPATTRYDQLDVYLINKELFSRSEYCREYKGTEQKPIKFAEAGEPIGSKSYDEAKFTLDIESTLCGSSYYPQSFAGKTCKGDICKEKGSVCLRCTLGLPECFGKKAGDVCVQMAIGVDVKYAEDVHPRSMVMIPICNYIQGKFKEDEQITTSQLGDVMGDLVELDVVDNGPTVLFKKAPDPSVYTEMQDNCSSAGGLRGVVLGIKYDDTSGLVTQVGDADDILVLGKSMCGTQGQAFAGYVDGTGGTDDFKAAAWCGYNKNPDAWQEKKELYWQPDEIEAAFNGSGKSLSCHVFLNKQVAPGDPRNTFNKDCKLLQVVAG